MTLPLIATFAFITSIFLTWILRRYAIAKSIIDIPNARSSHSSPTPRGGGVAIVISFFLSLFILRTIGEIESPLLWALLGAGLGIAILGFLDDHRHIAARWRLAGHFLGAIWILFWIGGFPPINAFGYDLKLLWIGNILAAVFLVWLLNLYNFMDGIDGLASIEAISVSLSGSFLYFYINETSNAILPFMLAASCAGFLLWNFPPAKIFMGDAGSGFLGITIATLSLKAGWVAPQLFWSWVILLGVFIVDATITLLRRLLRKEKLYEAHRSHAYQVAARRYNAHKPVSIAVGIINLLWLFPWAFLVATLKIDGVVAAIIAYVPIILLVFNFNAGAEE